MGENFALSLLMPTTKTKRQIIGEGFTTHFGHEIKCQLNASVLCPFVTKKLVSLFVRITVYFSNFSRSTLSFSWRFLSPVVTTF